jgi:asparagine synthase (glutamine-hydrolysing)
MSVLAGVVSRRRGQEVSLSWKAALTAAISRYPGEKIDSHESEAALLLGTHSGAFAHPAFRRAPSGSVAMLVGEPLLAAEEPGAGTNRERDLEILHAALEAGRWDILKSSAGSFAAVYFQPDSQTLHLIADKIGLRPLYYWVDDQWIVYASAMRILESLAFVPKEMDVRAVTEISAFSFPLGRRAPYAGIKTIKDAEIVSVDPKRIAARQYWRWDSLGVSGRSEPELLAEVYERFNVAVSRRLRGDRNPLAYLSGGLDSRAVVATLAAQSKTVHTLNFSLPRTQDRVYGAEMARRLGTIHHEEPFMVSNPNFLRRTLELAQGFAHGNSNPVERPLLVWSGDGGSVGLGHVYMTPRAVELIRKGDSEGMITQFLREEKKAVVARLLRPRVLKTVSEALREGMREELQDLRCEDPGRVLYLFLLLNDQRRHLVTISEDADLNRLEFVTPFFDAEFLASVMSVPIHLCLLHRFYNKWLSCFPPAVSSVPWQYYPTHEPCPVPALEGLVSQFDRSESEYLHAQKRQQLIQDTKQLLGSREFPDELLNRGFLRAAYLAYRWGVRDYAYVLDAALMYARYWKISQGRYRLPD